MYFYVCIHSNRICMEETPANNVNQKKKIMIIIIPNLYERDFIISTQVNEWTRVNRVHCMYWKWLWMYVQGKDMCDGKNMYSVRPNNWHVLSTSTTNAFEVIRFSPLYLLLFTLSIVLMRSCEWDSVCLYHHNYGCEMSSGIELA